MSKVSVIIPLYNRATLIVETLESLLVLQHPDTELEVIIVDDGSTDGGPELIEKNFPWVHLYKQVNSGAPVARNKGLQIATGEFILFLDSDDLIQPNFFNEKIRALEKDLALAAVYGPWEHFIKNDKAEHIIIPRHTPYPLVTYPDYKIHLKNLLGGWYIAPHALLWRKSKLIEINGFDPELIINQDVDLLFRVLLVKNLILGIKSPKAMYREHVKDIRTGSVAGSSQKLLTIFNLRKSFISSLETQGILSNENKESLGKFCFNLWGEFRETQEEIAEEFYRLSKELYPDLQLEGGLSIKILSKLLGPRRTVILKSLMLK